jgi:hypothetical protein
MAVGFAAGKVLAEVVPVFAAWPTVTPVAIGLLGAFVGFRVSRRPRRLIPPMLALCAAAAIYDYLARQRAPLVPSIVFALASLIVLAAWALLAAGRASQD